MFIPHSDGPRTNEDAYDGVHLTNDILDVENKGVEMRKAFPVQPALGINALYCIANIRTLLLAGECSPSVSKVPGG